MRLICGIVLGSVLLVSCNHPSDARLTTLFEEHREDFQALLAMVKQDEKSFSVLWVNLQPHQLLPAGAVLPEGRWMEYERLCKPLGVSVIEFHDGRLQLTVSAIGRFNIGTLKGFVFSESAPAPQLPSLDGGLPINPDPGEYEYGYSALGDNWYLFYARG